MEVVCTTFFVIAIITLVFGIVFFIHGLRKTKGRILSVSLPLVCIGVGFFLISEIGFWINSDEGKKVLYGPSEEIADIFIVSEKEQQIHNCILVKLENETGDTYEMSLSRKLIFSYNVGDRIACSFVWYPKKGMYENFHLFSSGPNIITKQ